MEEDSIIFFSRNCFRLLENSAEHNEGKGFL
jgi:hypothetical protein